MLRHYVSGGLALLDLAILGYFLAINTLYLLFCVVAYVQLRQHRRRWTRRELDAVMQSPATPAISIVAPAYNEEATLAESVRSLLLLNYPQFEVIVVNDGSTDGTLNVGAHEFELVGAPASYAQPIHTQPVRGIYQSLAHPELVMIDK
jgi:cellulose synthase/poly-beta-1,6-N-acetylglucosamine synthase-like glycosyltransferase